VDAGVLPEGAWMSGVAAIGEITFELIGQRAAAPATPVAGKVAGYEWQQARGFEATFELLDSSGRPATSSGELAFLIHRRFTNMQPPEFASDRAGIEAAQSHAAEQQAEARRDYLFYRVPAASGSGAGSAAGSAAPAGVVTFRETRPVVWWPVGIRVYLRFRIWAWFVPEGGEVVSAQKDIDLYWADAEPAPGDKDTRARHVTSSPS
jgi:hypothetical protein